MTNKRFRAWIQEYELMVDVDKVSLLLNRIYYDDHWLEAKLMQYTDLPDKNGKGICEGDIIELLDGTLAQVCFGNFEGYCPYDQMWMPSVGFYVIGINRYQKPMPLGPTEDYAVIKGNIYMNPELLKISDGGLTGHENL